MDRNSGLGCEPQQVRYFWPPAAVAHDARSSLAAVANLVRAIKANANMGEVISVTCLGEGMYRYGRGRDDAQGRRKRPVAAFHPRELHPPLALPPSPRVLMPCVCAGQVRAQEEGQEGEGPREVRALGPEHAPPTPSAPPPPMSAGGPCGAACARRRC